jgi:hypothetical protein
MIASSIILWQTTVYYKDGGGILTSLIKDWRWKNPEQKVYVLGFADNYKGVTILQSYEDAVSEALYMRAGYKNVYRPAWNLSHARLNKSDYDNIEEIMQFNMISKTDSVKVSKISDTQIDVVIGQWGTWFIKHGVGAGSYAKPDYKIDVYEYSYVLTLNKPEPDAVFIYQVGDKWKEFKMY